MIIFSWEIKATRAIAQDPAIRRGWPYTIHTLINTHTQADTDTDKTIFLMSPFCSRSQHTPMILFDISWSHGIRPRVLVRVFFHHMYTHNTLNTYIYFIYSNIIHTRMRIVAAMIKASFNRLAGGENSPLTPPPYARLYSSMRWKLLFLSYVHTYTCVLYHLEIAFVWITNSILLFFIIIIINI